jgi:2-phospho-L-lactate guanylyltransferase (CobY/MobA/RfbA family)
VLKQISIARAFTAYQMASLIMDRLAPAIEATEAKLVIVSDIAGTFLDEKIRADEEAEQIYSQVTAHLSKLAEQKQVIVLATYLPQLNKQAETAASKQPPTKRPCSSLISEQTNTTSYFVLEKHPHNTTGSAQFPSTHHTADQRFWGGFD